MPILISRAHVFDPFIYSIGRGDADVEGARGRHRGRLVAPVCLSALMFVAVENSVGEWISRPRAARVSQSLGQRVG